MPPAGSVLNRADPKAALRRRIATRRGELVAAAHTLAAPLRLVDRGTAAWRGLPAPARLALAAAGSFAVFRLLHSPRGRAAVWRLAPLLLGMPGRIPFVPSTTVSRNRPAS